MAQTPALLTLNAGSSSLKFAVFEIDRVDRRLISGSVERIGLDAARFEIADAREIRFSPVQRRSKPMIRPWNRC